MQYAPNPHDSVFVGQCLGLAFFSKLETAEQITDATCASEEDAIGLIAELETHGCKGVTIVPVASGHWTDLRAAGLDIGDMMNNALLYGETVGAA